MKEISARLFGKGNETEETSSSCVTEMKLKRVVDVEIKKIFQREGTSSRENIGTLDNEAFFFPFGRQHVPDQNSLSVRVRSSAIKPRCLRSKWHSVFSLANR